MKDSLTYYIVVDISGKPMRFDKDQLYDCVEEGLYNAEDEEYWPIKPVTKETAQKHIRLTNKYRKKHRQNVTKFRLMPVLLPKNIRSCFD